jgi:hypothetical protein
LGAAVASISKAHNYRPGPKTSRPAPRPA